MTLYQISELLQRLVKNGVIRGRDTLLVDDYFDLCVLAIDYVLFEAKKGNEMLYMELQVTNAEHDFKIINGKAEFPKGYNAQGISGAVLLDNSGYELSKLVIPLPKGASVLVSESFFTYYLIGQGGITFKNLPEGAKKLRLFNVCGTHPDDEINNSIAFAIFEQIYKLGQASEQSPKDTSANSSEMPDAVRAQIQQMINNPQNTES